MAWRRAYGLIAFASSRDQIGPIAHGRARYSFIITGDIAGYGPPRYDL
jgi:hypothetical protein